MSNLSWKRKLQLVAYALGLLAFAYPASIPLVFGAVFAVAGWALANLSLSCTIAAGLLLAYAFPSPLDWFGRALVASVAVVFPVKA